jgi:hypothetical protein
MIDSHEIPGVSSPEVPISVPFRYPIAPSEVLILTVLLEVGAIKSPITLKLACHLPVSLPVDPTRSVRGPLGRAECFGIRDAMHVDVAELVNSHRGNFDITVPVSESDG